MNSFCIIACLLWLTWMLAGFVLLADDRVWQDPVLFCVTAVCTAIAFLNAAEFACKLKGK